MEPPRDDKTSLGSTEPPVASADALSAYRKAKDWVSENPGQAACYTVGAASLAVVAAPALVSAPILTAMGFGAQGVIANSAAAAAQASIGNVVAPSLFSTFTSAGMAGYGAAIVNGAVQAGAGATAAGSGGYIAAKRWFGGEEKKTESEEDDRASEDNGDSGNGSSSSPSRRRI
ncbi:hypothetical protein CGRA01v4_09564 [Colletotrichum graminicola]|uniref:Interferon-induced 6-16 n=1 Tax=Colletotrichum graminicola (strain M1.001 / M2 / FGSC 10212) TaxID=645133 RepID=E3QP22_COLGM|nr:uncharacterized protein GLRG_07624 [Colletotrichum graminicola M1.001]EFQ32610.1 hypothetical protein GLRG_07624 [Colletotrichum graminicola M1.001]WDK18279.1 hypothetical protein CGRA01v4_09564 [Colletotrichum graminicola]